MNDAPAPLAPDYYLTNFLTLLDWVETRYGDMLSPRLQRFSQQFRALSRPAMCLLVRLAGRKYRHFLQDSLRYSEIADIPQAIDELAARNFIKRNPASQLCDLSPVLTLAQLRLCFADRLDKPQLKLPKAQLIEYLQRLELPNVPWSGDVQTALGDLLVLTCQEDVDDLQLLFFGNPYQSLTEFVLQDLGIFRFENYALTQAHRLFQHPSELEQYKALQALKDATEDTTDMAALQALTAQLPFPAQSHIVQRRQMRLINRIAYRLEQAGELTEALRLYQHSTREPARERTIRVLDKLGEPQRAWQLAEQMWQQPNSEQERQVATRLLKRLAKKCQKPFHTQPEPEIDCQYLTLRASESQRVEEVTRQFLASADAPCEHAENALFSGLLGLWMWDAMFADITGAFAHPFQLGPLDIYQSDFVLSRHEVFAALWQQLDDGSYVDAIRDTYQRKVGVSNLLVDWRYMNSDRLEMALSCISAEILKKIFSRMLFDLRANRAGLPDLIQFFPQSSSFCLIEVKGPGDKLQDNQIRWLRFFTSQGIAAHVAYVSWQ